MSVIPDVIGRYRVLRCLGEGGMGSVFMARDPSVNRLVAVKLIYQARGSDLDVLRERLRREARAVASLSHPNIITLFEFGSHEGEPFIAMEYVQGQTLASLIKEERSWPLERRLEIIEQICGGLHYAHGQGIIHRDVKPANVMVRPDGVVKILDFGISRAVVGEDVTVTGNIVGTLNYMSPERFSGEKADARSDQFSVGALLYEVVSRRLAFPGDLQVLVARILNGHAEPLAEVCPDAPGGLFAIVDRMLARDPDARYLDLSVACEAIQGVRRQMGGGAAPPTVDMPPLPPSQPGAIVWPIPEWSEAETGSLQTPIAPVIPAAPVIPVTPVVVEAPVRGPARRAWTAAWWLMAALLIAAGVWLLSTYLRQPSPPAPLLTDGTVAIEFLPWASIERIVRKSDGRNVAPPGLVTPDRLSLPPGEYHIVGTNPKYQTIELDFVVPAGGVVELRRSLQGLQPDEAAKRGLRHVMSSGGGR